MERIVTLNNFKKLNIASAISLAVLAFPAQAVVQIKDDVQLTDESYTEALQWMPGAAGNALELNNVTVVNNVDGASGIDVASANGNDITIRDSDIKGGWGGYSLHFKSVTGSNILIDNTALSSHGDSSSAYLYASDLLSGSNLTFKDSTLTGGKRGISITNAENGSVITADNTQINEVSSIGVWVSKLTDSTLNILNGSNITSKNIGLAVTEATGSEINIDKSTISAGGRGFSADVLQGSTLNILNGSKIISEDIAVYIKSMNDSSSLTISDSLISGKNKGLETKLNGGSSLNITDSTITGGSDRGLITTLKDNSVLNILNGSVITGKNIGLAVTEATGSEINIDKSTISGESNQGINTTLNDNSSLNISGSTLSGKKNGLRADVKDSSVTIDNSSFTGAYGINFSGHNSEIALSNSHTSGIYLKANKQSVDIVNSDIGRLRIDGLGSNESKPMMNNNVNIESSKMEQLKIIFGEALSGGNTVNVVNSEIISLNEDEAAIFMQDNHNNTINVKGSTIKGDIVTGTGYGEPEPENNTINLDSSHFEGAIETFYDDGKGNPNPDHPGLGSVINMGNNTTWVAKGESNAETLNITDSTVDIQDAIVGADNWHSENTNVLINSESQLNIGTGSGDMNMVIQSDGKELETLGKEIITVQNGEMDIQADDVDLGAYKYKLVNKDGKWVLERLESKEWTELEDGSKVVLSNSANAALSSLAAAQASWNSQTGAVYERLNTRMEQDTGGVWGTYYGNEWAGEAGLSSTFNQKINGMAIGADKTLPLKDGQVTMGVAVMHDNSHLSGFDEKGSGGSMNSTAVHAYGRLAMNNGLFFKGTASAGSASSKLHANSSDGSVSKGDYKQNLFGLTGQAGYRYQVTPDVYVSPYAQMNGYTASATHFSLDNGMEVNSDRYWSARGELGVEAGVKTSVAGMAVTPHVMAAAGHEFVKNNDVHLNDIGAGFNNTVDGSGYKLGAGVEAQMTKNLSAGVNVNYSRSQDVEQRFGLSAGVRYDF